MQWKQKTCPYLKTVLRQVQNTEQTQEVRLSEEMPDIGRVLCAWGQCSLRGKQWRQEEITAAGGVTAWVLYLPEDGSYPKVVEAWLPFQVRWNLPQTQHSGTARVKCSLKGIDARTLSARKLMLRANVSAMAEALEPSEAVIFSPEEVASDVALLTQTYPAVLPCETGEKPFAVEEEVRIDGAENWFAWSMETEITEQGVLGNRAVVRGVGHLRGMYTDAEGTIHAHSLTLPFAQFIDLDREYDKLAELEIVTSVSGLETERVDGGVHIICNLSVQYLVSDSVLLSVTEDAYSPVRNVELTRQTLTLPMELETRTEQVELSVPMPEGKTIQTCFGAEFPVLFREGENVHIALKGSFQTLFEDTEGNLQTAEEAWTREMQLPTAAQTQTIVEIASIQQQESSVRLCVVMRTRVNQEIPMLVDMTLGEPIVPDENRPTLILRRMEENSLWELAKMSGSTVEAIREANALTQEPERGQMLLIPLA